MASQSEGREEGNAQISAAVRHFKPGNVVKYGFLIYNAKLDSGGHPQLLLKMRLFRDGAEVFTGKDTQFDPGQQRDLQRITAGGGVQLGTDMTPGDYVIQIVVTDLLADKKHSVATQWMDFQVVR
jgi:hypothetical protein